MDAVERAMLMAHRGLVGNTDQGGRRQGTLREQDAWQRLMARLGTSVFPSTRRANLLRSGTCLVHARNKIVRIGGCRRRLLGETKPCERRDAAFPGRTDAMYTAWGGGACGEVLDHEESVVGDAVLWLEEALIILSPSTPPVICTDIVHFHAPFP